MIVAGIRLFCNYPLPYILVERKFLLTLRGWSRKSFFLRDISCLFPLVNIIENAFEFFPIITSILRLNDSDELFFHRLVLPTFLLSENVMQYTNRRDKIAIDFSILLKHNNSRVIFDSNYIDKLTKVFCYKLIAWVGRDILLQCLVTRSNIDKHL